MSAPSNGFIKASLAIVAEAPAVAGKHSHSWIFQRDENLAHLLISNCSPPRSRPLTLLQTRRHRNEPHEQDLLLR